ncbi:MAG: DegQ family serine endoprotease [Burkholderiales bacterium]|nr:DegQ family serine endoprotease [Burkholderiales bacterium]
MRSLCLAALLFVCSLGARAQLPDFTELVEKYGPAVVNVSTTSAPRARAGPRLPNVPEDDPFYEFFRRFMPQIPGPREFESQSLGSGFIISADGYVLTNAHVVEAADEITVKLNDKREFKAKVIGSDRKTDIALLKIDATGLPAVQIGDPSKVKVGEWVIAIGSPFGFESTVTAGIVSAKGRSLPQENFVPFIQTDVAVNPGNSGGPLFNLRGEVIGVNSQIYSRTGGFMGLSFAIPIDVAMDIQQQLRTAGKVTRGRIGVGIQPVTKEMAESFGLPKAAGALVNAVEPGSPAEKGGVQVSDVIVRFDGKPVNSADDLVRFVGNTKPGSRIQLQVWRAKTTRDLTVTVGEMPDDRSASRAPRRGAPGKPAPDTAVVSKLGMTLSDLREEQLKELKLTSGVLVEEATGTAARAGIRRGDVIIAINNQSVKSVDQFAQLIGQIDKGRSVALLVRRAGGSIYVPLRIE